MHPASPYLLLSGFVGLSLFGAPAAAQEGVPPPPAGAVLAPPPGAPPEPVPAPAPPPAAAPPGPSSTAPLPPTQLGKPVIDVSVPEPGPAVERSLRMHNGFYLRLSAGALWGGTFVSSSSASHKDYTADGFGFSFDAMVGGTVSGSLAVGGALSGQGFGAGGTEGGAGLVTLGAFVDGFPMPEDGFHLGGMLGVAGSSASRRGYSTFKGAGPGMAAWIGYDGWVADEWSMGGLLKLSGALAWGKTSDAGPDVSLAASTYEVTLLFSVLYH